MVGVSYLPVGPVGYETKVRERFFGAANFTLVLGEEVGKVNEKAPITFSLKGKKY